MATGLFLSVYLPDFINHWQYEKINILTSYKHRHIYCRQ